MEPLDSLTPDVLGRLYLDERLTDTQIAHRYGTHQVKICRLRKRWGIETILKSDRLNLPTELTARQRSILIGSMLGDGGLSATGSDTARYAEMHSLAQTDYLNWKAQEWGPFYASTGTVRKGGHTGLRYSTHGCRVLFPYWKKFYPSGAGEKVFNPWLIEEVDGLALAVWFMDDGSKASSYFRFSVGPNVASQQVQLGILRKFDVRARLYGGDSILITNRTDLTRFVDVVAPHIHPSMAYKLELVKTRRMGSSPRDVLTMEKLQPLVERGMSAVEISKVFKVSRQSVCRALDRMGVERKVGRSRSEDKREYSQEVANTLISELKPSLENIPEVVRVLSRTEIPIRTPTLEELQEDKELILRARTELNQDGSVQGVSKGGTLICNTLFGYRWDARYRNNSSMREAWYAPEMLAKAVKFQLAVGDPVNVLRVFRALQVVVRAPTNFRPCVAKAVIQRFSPEGGLVLDPCAGYGGRALGALASGRRYVGVDPNTSAPASFKALHDLMGGSLQFHNDPYEDVVLGDVQADLVFTSPPYFSVERYEDRPSQSWIRYKTWELWVRGFLKPFVTKSWEHTRLGGFFVVNTKDIRYGQSVYSIPGEILRLAEDVGFKHMGTLSLSIGRVGKNPQSEPLLVFRKDSESKAAPLPWPEPAKKSPKPARPTIGGLTVEVLRDLYETKLMTDAQIAKQFGVSDVAVSQHRRLLGVETITSRQRAERKESKPSLSSLTRDRLVELYRTMSDSQIAAMFGTSKVTIRKRRKAYGIDSHRKHGG